jgi:hypothetical protein
MVISKIIRSTLVFYIEVGTLIAVYNKEVFLKKYIEK